MSSTDADPVIETGSKVTPASSEAGETVEVEKASADSVGSAKAEKVTESADKDNEEGGEGDEDTDEDAEGVDGDTPSSSSLFRINSGLLPFPEKLMSLLDGEKMSDSMWWLPDGDSFCLVPVVFAERVLDKHFQGTKFESFTRKLNRWGFKRVAGQKVPINTIAYYNKNFLRGKPKLLKNMNGGKTKFISAREKRMRAQMKRDRDREQAVMIAAQQQAMFPDPRGGNHSGMGGFSMIGSGMGATGSMGRGALDSMHLQSMLASRPGLSQSQGDMSIAEQVFAAKQAMAMQQQREELQLGLLRQGSAMSGLRDPASMAASNHFLAARNSLGLNMLPQYAGNSLAGGHFPRHTGMGDNMSNTSMSMNGGDMTTEQFLLARQFANGNDNSNTSMVQRIMSQNMGSNDHGSNQLNDEKLMKMARSSGGGHRQEGQGVDEQLLQLYLMEQQQRNLNARQA